MLSTAKGMRMKCICKDCFIDVAMTGITAMKTMSVLAISDSLLTCWRQGCRPYITKTLYHLSFGTPSNRPSLAQLGRDRHSPQGCGDC